jgi:hypothetical protein
MSDKFERECKMQAEENEMREAECDCGDHCRNSCRCLCHLNEELNKLPWEPPLKQERDK